VEFPANIGPPTSLDIGQTTRTTPGISVGHATAPVASGVPLYLMPLMGMTTAGLDYLHGSCEFSDGGLFNSLVSVSSAATGRYAHYTRTVA